jgi:hypothetical protein
MSRYILQIFEDSKWVGIAYAVEWYVIHDAYEELIRNPRNNNNRYRIVEVKEVQSTVFERYP